MMLTPCSVHPECMQVVDLQQQCCGMHHGQLLNGSGRVNCCRVSGTAVVLVVWCGVAAKCHDVHVYTNQYLYYPTN